MTEMVLDQAVGPKEEDPETSKVCKSEIFKILDFFKPLFNL